MVDETNENVMGEEILDAGYALEALRETGYKNTAYALSELIDNSIDANAMDIDVVALEMNVAADSGRMVDRITSLAVIDNGDGIPAEVLSKCLSIGFGTKFGNNQGIGRFGYGLKGGSISQCRKIEVYSWRENKKPLYTFLDLDEIKEKTQTEIPAPIEKSLPQFLSNFGNTESGTAIVWDKLDKLDYKSSKGLYGMMNSDLSRLFRNFLDDDNTYGIRRDIKLRVVEQNGEEIYQATDLKANDPTYRLKPNTLDPMSENEALEKGFKENRDLSNRATNIEHNNYTKEVEYIDKDGGLQKSSIQFIFTLV